MLSREEKYIYEWETRRGKGKWSYVILTALIWGTIFPCVIQAFKLALKGQLGISQMKSVLFNQSFLFTWQAIIAGILFCALLMWRLAKNKYLEFKKKQLSRTQHFFDSQSSTFS
jgi:hypothetical protein